MKNKNLALLFSAGAVVVILGVLVPVLQKRQETRQRAAGPEHQLPTSAYRNPYYPTNIPQGNIQLPVPPEGQAYKAPNDTMPPRITITAPQNGSQVTVNTAVTLSATATDDTGVSKVEFLVNGQVICDAKTSPYTCTWQVPFQTNSTYVVIARANDLTGNLSSQSSIIYAH